MKIAKRRPFEGIPRIMAPNVYGASSDKPFLYRIPVLGQRPISVRAENLPNGLAMDENGVISGMVTVKGVTFVTVHAENALGTASKVIRFEIFDDNLLRTPMMGFTSWNAFGEDVTQEHMLKTAHLMIEMGFADYGYSYVNLDSSWQGDYGGKYDAIMPNDKFPDMKAMCDQIHALGLKAGIYSSPMRHAWGTARNRTFSPGCTRGERDLRFADTMTGIGVEHREAANVAQWTEWGFDYLKYDWSPTDPINADLMKQALRGSSRDIAYCVTVKALPGYADYWKRNCHAWRCCNDTHGNWENVAEQIGYYEPWQQHSGSGHYCDLDMLAIGKMDKFTCTLTEEEKVFDYTMRAFMASPIQLSCHLDALSEFELDLFCNEEIIAINQDGMLQAPVIVRDEERLQIYRKPLENGEFAIAIFNISDDERSAAYELPEQLTVRDVWVQEDMGQMQSIECTMPPHSVRVFRMRKP